MTVFTDDETSRQRFAEEVLARVALAEEKRRNRDRLRYLWPIAIIVVVGVSWSIALLDGTTVLRLLIQIAAWIGALAIVEQHLTSVLLGPFWPLPGVISLLLFLAAIVWVRVHQPEPPEMLL
ncbi:MAG TPA: hypothetical protein VMW65_14035 [Chloroflexota bacterium]|nr:hypothetical protein [Chloroflexota bacterium]